MSFPFIGKEQELLEAARTGNLSTITRLLTSKPRKSVVGGAIGQKITSFLKSVNVNCTDKNSYTPLHHAAVNGHREVVEALLKADAQPGLKDNQGCSPVHLAAWSGEPVIVSLLLGSNAESDASGGAVAPVHVNQQNNNGDTALHCAAQYGHLAVVDVLLQNNANPTVRNLEELSPLDLAAQYGHLEVVRLILINHPDLAQLPLFNHSPLHQAASNGHKDIVEVLLDNGFDIHTVTETGTALHEAALHGKLDVVRLLLEKGVDVNQRDMKGQTVLQLLSAHQAQQKSFTHIVQAITDFVNQTGSMAEGTYETLTSCHSGGKPTAAVKPLPPERPKKPEKPVTPDKQSVSPSVSSDKPTPSPRPSVGSPGSPPACSGPIEDGYATPFKDKDDTHESIESGTTAAGPASSKAPPPLPPRSSIFPSEDQTSTALNLDSTKQDKVQEKTSPDPSPRAQQGIPKKPPRHKPPRQTVCQSPPKPDEGSPSTKPTQPPPPPAHKPEPPFPDLYSTIADTTPSTDPASSENVHTVSKDDTDCVTSMASSKQSNDSSQSQNLSSKVPLTVNLAPEVTPSAQKPNKLDNSIDPQTGKQVHQSFYMEMKNVDAKSRPVSEVKPQRKSDIDPKSYDTKVDHYGILYPNLRSESDKKSKRPPLQRSNTAPEESVYVGPSPVSTVDRFKDKHGLLRRANTAPEESEYTSMSSVARSKEEEEAEGMKENEYAEIPEKDGDTSPKSPKENVYASIDDKANLDTNMLSQLSEFSSTLSQNQKGEDSTSPVSPNHKEDNSTISVLPNQKGDISTTTQAPASNERGSGVTGKPKNLPFSSECPTNTPLTPTGYVQPPTPDFPPPSPATALMGIELKIQEMDSKRKSRDITTITDDTLADIASQGQISRASFTHEVKVTQSERSSCQGHIVTPVIEETVPEESRVDVSKTAEAASVGKDKSRDISREVAKDSKNKTGDIQKETTKDNKDTTKDVAKDVLKDTTQVTVIKTEDIKTIPESSIPDKSVIKTESSTVSSVEKSEQSETETEMFRRNKKKDQTSEKEKVQDVKGKKEADKKPSKPSIPPKTVDSSDKPSLPPKKLDSLDKPSLPPKRGSEALNKVSTPSKKGGETETKPSLPPKKGTKPEVQKRPLPEVVQEAKGPVPQVMPDMAKELKDRLQMRSVKQKMKEEDKATKVEANGAVTQGSPVTMRKKSEPDMFADLKRGSTIGLSTKARSTYNDVIIKNAPENRKSLHTALLSSGPVMEKDEDIDFDQVMASIDSEVAKAPTSVHHDSMTFDDSEEWEKIADIMSSFAGDLAPALTVPKENITEEAFEAYMDRVLSRRERGSSQMQSVGEWLEMIGMSQYENQFITNGFDNIDFLGPNILEEQDLEQIKVLNHEHRQTILQTAVHLPQLHPIDPKSPPKSVEEWLTSLQLQGYLETFKCHGYDTMEKVQSILWDLQLRTVLDISMLGHRKRILASLGERSPDKVNNKRPSLSSLSPDKAKSRLGDLDFYRDYTGVKPVSSSEEDIKETMAVASSEEEEDVFSKTGQGISDSNIHVRPPHMAQTSSPAKQWRHKPEMLIKGCCNYTAQYLGSTIVPELTGGVDSTRAGITKMKLRFLRQLQKSTDMLSKIPIIMLSISYKGVKFIDAKSKKVICDHDISNIFCACQDTENLNFFAYITRDIESSHHYCHVFSVKSASLAHDIILTLGESFEVAYQIALKDRSRQEAMQLDRQISQSDAEDAYSVSSKKSTNTV